MFRFCHQLIIIYYLTVISLPKTSSTVSQSYLVLSNIGLEFSPFDEDALLLLETNSNSIPICAQTCYMMARCRTFNFDIQTKRCRLYEGDVDSTGIIAASLSPQSICGSIQLTVNDFADYGRACSSCEGSRYLTCINSTWQCQLHTYFNGSICVSQKVNGGECTDDIQCRHDLNLTCQSNMQCGHNFTSNYTTSAFTSSSATSTSTSSSSSSSSSTSTSSSTTSTSTTSTSTATKTSTTRSVTTTTTTTRMPCNSSCLNQTWTSSANRLAQWLFDGSYYDQMNNYNITPANNMSFTNNTIGYVKQAIQFVHGNNQTLNVPYIPLSSTSFTIDVWLYITGLQNVTDHGIFCYCSQITIYNCLYLTIRQTGSNYYLYLGFYQADCEGITPLTLNTWIHAAFVFDSTTLTQKIYRNGVLENSCTQASALTVTPTNITIGFLPLMYATSGGVAYFQGYMDEMTVSNRVKSACEVLEIATLVAHFTFDTGSFLADSGPNSLTATTQSTSSVSSGRYSQAIHFNGSTSSYYQISDITAMGISNQAFSISLWIRPTSLLGIVLHVSALSSGVNAYCLRFLGFTTNGVFVAQIFNGSGYPSVLDPANSIAISVWSHIVQTWSSTNGLRLYINNVLVASRLNSATIFSSSSAPLYLTLANGLSGAIICDSGPIDHSPYNGDMDDFRVYSRELSADDVCTLYNN